MRPVDLAIDPTARVVNAVVALLLVLGVFGPLLLVGSWLDLLRDSPLNRGLIGWFLDKRKTAHLVLSVVLLAIGLFLSRGPDLLLALVIGPVMAISVIARAVDLNEELPRILRIERIRPMRLLASIIAALVLFLGLRAWRACSSALTCGRTVKVGG